MKTIFNILSVVLLSSTGIKAFLATQVMCEAKTTTTKQNKNAIMVSESIMKFSLPSSFPSPLLPSFLQDIEG